MLKKKKIVLYVWLFFIAILLLLYFLNISVFDINQNKLFFANNLFLGLFIYFIIGTLRGFTLLPSTPIVLAGSFVFPPVYVFLVNLVCVFTSSAIVYYWSSYLEFDKYFNKKYPKQLKKIKKVLKKKELPFIALWSFFPFVPTDLICYVSEVLNIKIWKCLVGVAIGEGIICAIYIFGTNNLLSFFNIR